MKSGIAQYIKGDVPPSGQQPEGRWFKSNPRYQNNYSARWIGGLFFFPQMTA